MARPPDALASAWSEDTAYEVGTLLAEEAMAQGIHVVLGPTINLHRSLLGRRLFEAYSEDPCSPANSPPPTSAACKAAVSVRV